MSSISTESTCPICFDSLSNKTKSSPDNCDHIFCLTCLEKWSKLGSYCPVDRKRFKKILNLDSDHVIQVKSQRRKRKRRTYYDFTTNCEICSDHKNANVMLLCDCCDLGYHIHCLSPPLKEVPSGLWFCPTCISVEEKIKKNKGITKEVEAELGCFDNTLLYKNAREKAVNKKQPEKNSEESNLSSASTIKNTSILETCHSIISEFEDMTVRRNCSKNVCSSKYLDEAVNKIDKIYKTFDVNCETSSQEHRKTIKTYSAANACRKMKRIEPFDVQPVRESSKNNNYTNAVDLCDSKSSVLSNSALKDHTVSSSVSSEHLNIDMFCNDASTRDETIINLNLNADTDQIELYSETNEILPEELSPKSSPLRSKLISPVAQTLKPFDLENMPMLDKIAQETSPPPKRNSNKLLAKRQKESCKSVITSYEQDFVSSRSHVKDRRRKGTSNNLIQFSIFKQIEGIESSQDICSQISSSDTPFSPNIQIHKQPCSISNNELTEDRCKLCMMKYFRAKKSKRFLNYVTNLKKELGYKHSGSVNMDKKNNDWRALETNKNLKSSRILEKRKQSLIHMIKKIHDSKYVNSVSQVSI